MPRPIRFPLIAIVALLATPLQCQTTGILPDTPPGRRLAELITILNSGNYDSIRAYAGDHLSEDLIAGKLDARVDALMRIHAQSQELTFVRVLSSSRDRVIAAVGNRLAEMNQALGVSVERRPPHRITMWYRGPANLYREPAGAAQPAESDIVAAIDSYLDRVAAADVFSGTVLIGREDSILLLRAVGPAHRDPDVANTTDTRFNIASVGKLFTAVAVAQLAERALLTYREPIGRHLGPDWVSHDVASQIRIEHLLTHRSGLGDFLESEAMLHATAPPSSLADYRPIIQAERPQFTPGTRFQYSNSGFIVLGAVLERISGQTFTDYFQQHVFAPAGMVGPSDPPRDRAALPAPAFATGYTSHYAASGRNWSDNTGRMANTAASPAGGQFASAEDLWRFATALRSGALVRDSTWQSLAAPVPVRGGPPRSYGFEITDRGEERRVGHGGSHDGIGAVLDIYLQSGYTLVVLSNSDRSAFAVREKFTSLLMP
ncbi:MAG: serine hydrolase [Gemmatimonadales bacterium]|nr:serine hydrolase [Gemmatimonadales bacterium]